MRPCLPTILDPCTCLPCLYMRLGIPKCTKCKRLSHYLIRCVQRADFHFVEAFGLYYSYTQYWTHSSKGYLVHWPCFPRYTCLHIRKSTKFRRLLHYLIRCVQKADFHFMEAYGLYYSYTQYWTHSSKGYTTCFRCVQRADFHFMEAYGLYYSYTQYWTHSSKGYLVHGPYFPRYTCLDIRLDYTKMHWFPVQAIITLPNHAASSTKFKLISILWFPSLWSVLLVHPILDP